MFCVIIIIYFIIFFFYYFHSRVNWVLIFMLYLLRTQPIGVLKTRVTPRIHAHVHILGIETLLTVKVASHAVYSRLNVI